MGGIFRSIVLVYICSALGVSADPTRVIASVTALYDFTVNPATSHSKVCSTHFYSHLTPCSQLIRGLARVFRRSSDLATESSEFSIESIRGLDGGPCSGLASEPASPPSWITTGCNRVTFKVHAASSLTEYSIRHLTTVWPIRFATLASEQGDGFSVCLPPSTFAFPSFQWLEPSPAPAFSVWKKRSFPQSLWEKQAPECVSGISCPSLPVAPSARYQHSAVMYRTWNFERDVLGHSSLCKNGANSNSACTESCLTDSSCFSPGLIVSGAPTEPVLEPDSANCPSACCGAREACRRTRDDVGRRVEFDRNFLLFFAGKTVQKASVGGLDLYKHCEDILASGLTQEEASKYASCLEFQSEELWRYSPEADVWELLKPRTLELKSSENDVVYPPGRFGHAAALATIPAASDIQNTRRQYMFVFGGFSINCDAGLCSDLWRYEIPWAAQAYWPAGAGGNVWKRMASCPFGGLYRHSMVATDSGSALVVFGGQKIGEYSNQVYVYTLGSDSWEQKVAVGYAYFTRSAVDYGGKLSSWEETDFDKFVEGEDTWGPAVVSGQVPGARGDHTCAASAGALFISGGFRTYSSPYPKSAASDIPYPTYPYYPAEDLWRMDLSSQLWERVFVKRNSSWPAPRRGSASVLIDRLDGDPLLLIFGGSRADQLMNDTWVLDVERAPRDAKVWRRLDTKWISSEFPPNTTFHTLSFETDEQELYVFGGISWTPSDTAVSDLLTDADRRCSMQARSLLLVTCDASEMSAGAFADASVCALAKAKSDIATQCTAAISSFCCDEVARFSAIGSLMGLSDLCTAHCTSESFRSEFTLTFSEGIWVANLAECENSCSGHGDCELAICRCRPGWTGSDCSDPVCPGGFCFLDAVSLDSHCVACSGNGRCDVGGVCACNSGWGGEDCATANVTCAASGTLLNEEFPITQCVCDERFSGPTCATQLCLNACSGKGKCTDGFCACETGYYGDDCSVFLFTAHAQSAGLLAVLAIVLIVLMFLGYSQGRG